MPLANKVAMLDTVETDAHLALIKMLELPGGTGYHGLAATPHLRKFRRRCPGCRNVLRVSAWVDGLRVMWCRGCGHKHKECAT